MECFNHTVDTITHAFQYSLRKRGMKGDFVINVQKTKYKFNIWTFRFELILIVSPGISKSVYTLQQNQAVPNGKEDEIKDSILVCFLQELFEKQEDIWNLINTSQH